MNYKAEIEKSERPVVSSRLKPGVWILDSTLREGEQSPGVSFPVHVKLALAEYLDRLGIDVVEAGHPLVGEEIRRTVSLLASSGRSCRIGAHARALKEDIEAAVACDVDFIGIFYCLSAPRLQDSSMTLSGALDMIGSAVALARRIAPSSLIRFTPEDTVRTEPRVVINAAVTAVRAGADIISIADTTGSLIPGSADNMYDWVKLLRHGLERAGIRALIEVHCHNDRGLALANALDGYRAGADIIDAAVLGLGERAGITDLACLMAVLRQDFGEGLHWNLAALPALYETVARYSGTAIPRNHPVCGRYAFSHCAGVHSRAVLKDTHHYQSLDPGLFGRRSEIVLDQMAGRAALDHALSELGREDLAREERELILQQVKAVGRRGALVDLQELDWIVRSISLQTAGKGSRSSRRGDQLFTGMLSDPG